MTTRRRLSPEETTTLAGDLLRQLAEQIGDEEAISATISRWRNVLGGDHFGVVCMNAVRLTFRDCLTHTPIADVPPGAVAFAKERA